MGGNAREAGESTSPTTLQVTQTRILVVDDSASARNEVLEVLSRTLPALFTTAADGEEGLWKARSSPHDLVITDIHMPKMDGLEFVRQLRKRPSYATVPVLVLTWDATRERLQEGRRAGVSGWLIKPPKPDALVMTVRHALFDRR